MGMSIQMTSTDTAFKQAFLFVSKNPLITANDMLRAII